MGGPACKTWRGRLVAMTARSQGAGGGDDAQYGPVGWTVEPGSCACWRRPDDGLPGEEWLERPLLGGHVGV